MKKIQLILVALVLLTIYGFAQVPQAIPYQAVARNAAGNPVSNQAISIRFSILNNAANGPLLYRETQTATTNSLGLFSVNVGTGTIVSGTFSSINWGVGNKYLQVDLDITGGTSYITMGTQQMMSVPFALQSGNVPVGTAVGQILVWNGQQWAVSTICSLFQSDPNNCGSCGNVCLPTVPNGTSTCINGQCVVTCNSGFANCDNVVANGCEVNLLTDLSSCGTCGNTCGPIPNGHTNCVNGICTVTCDQGFADCDNLTANGCEVNLYSSPSNCGNCNIVCPARPNATPACQQGFCYFECLPGFGDCDGNPNNGCETDFSTNLSNCGGCGITCNFPNAFSVCQAGVCVISQCNPGFANCDGITANGCEVNLSNNPNHCGTCGHVCPSGNCFNNTCQ